MQTIPPNLPEREEAIAAAWYQALAQSGELPQPVETVQRGLQRIVNQIGALLAGDSYPASEARLIGHKIAQLGFQQVDTLTLLKSIWLPGNPPESDSDTSSSTNPGLGRIWIDLTAGFLDHHHNLQLLEREQALEDYEAEWKRFLASRQDMEQKSQAILRALPDTVSIVTLDGVVLYYHRGADQRFSNEDELTYKNIHSYLPDELAKELLMIYFGVIETGRPRTHEYSVVLEDGTKHEYQDNVTPYLGNSVLVISRDLTHQKHIEEELRASEARYRSVLETQNEIIGRFTPDGTITFINLAAQRLFGIATEEILGRNIFEFAPEIAEILSEVDTPDPGLPPAQSAMSSREITVIPPNGKPTHMEVTTKALFNRRGEITEYQSTGRDVTALRLMEDALRKSEARYRSMVEGQTEFICRYLMDGSITFVNDALCKFFSKTEQELLGSPMIELVYDADRAIYANQLVELSNQEPENPIVTGQVRMGIANDDIRWIEWTTRVIFGPAGNPVECQSVGRDVTLLKEAQKILEQRNELLRQLGEQLINVQENERQRIALDLHDSVLNELGAMLIAPQEMLTPQMVHDNYEQLIDQLRQTINGLRSPMISYGLYTALEDLMDSYLDNPQAESLVSMDIPPCLARFDPNVELHLYRIVQQACDNAMQHAQATSIRIYGLIDENQVALTVEDDGIGFPLGEEADISHILVKKHFGLVSMIERGKLIGADVKISSNPGAGTKVSVLWEPVYYWT